MSVEKIGNLTIVGDHDEKTKNQMWTCMGVGSVVGGVLCADGHLGYAQPVGGVVAYENHVSVSGVGFDIACGNMAVKLKLKKDAIHDSIGTILKDISKTISFGVGRTAYKQVDHAIFDDPTWDEVDEIRNLKTLARDQLGTVGSGNHYVDVFEDEEGWLWIGCHFGSRGFGHKTATKFLKLAGGKDGMEVAPAIIDVNTELGQKYIKAMELAGKYAYAGREWVVTRVRVIIGGAITETVHNHHNFAWHEQHGDRKLWVIRKGATPAFRGQKGFIGGSMGDNAVIISGVDAPESAGLLYSTVHGAGRLLSRSEAKGKSLVMAVCDECDHAEPWMEYEYERKQAGKREGQPFTMCPYHPKGNMTKKRIRQDGMIRSDEMQEWLRKKGVTLLGGDVDEAPQAYRRLDEVLTHHDGTINIEHILKPFIVVMAGRDTFDPYKD